MSRHSIICKCGATNAVSATNAGLVLACVSCGRPLEVPRLGELHRQTTERDVLAYSNPFQLTLRGLFLLVTLVALWLAIVVWLDLDRRSARRLLTAVTVFAVAVAYWPRPTINATVLLGVLFLTLHLGVRGLVASRDHARQTQCSDRMREMGRAWQQREDACRGADPPSTVALQENYRKHRPKASDR